MIENDVPSARIGDPKLFAQPAQLHGMLKRLRRTDPLSYVEAPDYDPFWLVTRYQDIVKIELQPDIFINAPRQAIFPVSHQERSRRQADGRSTNEMMRNLTGMDGSDHRAYRAIAQSQFLAKALNRIRDDVKAIAAEFVDRLVDYPGECDFATDIAFGYPLRVIMSILGVPAKDEALMLKLTQQLLTSQDSDLTAGANPIDAMRAMAAYFAPIISAKRANPDGDIASVIATAKVDGEYLAERDVFGYCMIIATAGHDTTSYSLTGGLSALLDHPDQMAMLRADKSLMPSAVEEIIRWATPVKHFARTATQNAVVAGKQIAEGDALMLSYASANRDEDIFDDPFDFRVARKPNRHLAFGTGPHLCLGQHLAKMELAAFFTDLLEKISHIEAAGEPRYVEGTFVGGIKNLPVRFKIN